MSFNFAQGIEAFLLAYLGEKEFEKAAIYGVSTLVSTGISSIGADWFAGSAAQHYVTEPVIAGVLSGVGMYAFKKKEKDRFLSPFARGFAYTGASAGLNSAFANNYLMLGAGSNNARINRNAPLVEETVIRVTPSPSASPSPSPSVSVM